MIELFLFFIFYYHNKIEEGHLRESLFLEMKNYSFNFEDKRFDMDIVVDEENKLYELMFDKKSIYILAPLLESSIDKLKIYYPLKKYKALLSKMHTEHYFQFVGLSIVALIMALIFSYYSLKPLRNSLRLLEEFTKDIIHDLNTPISSILINLKMMAKNDEAKSIEQSAKSIAMLHKNLDSYLRNAPIKQEILNLEKILQEQITFFKPLYDYLNWEIKLDEYMVQSDRSAVERIFYNLLSNACKYNTNQGDIIIQIVNKKVIITNDSYGIKNPSKVFNRFYKESTRGLGIGLHIVEKLCSQLDIKKELHVKANKVTVTLLF